MYLTNSLQIVFTYVHPETLLAARGVCKAWKGVVDSVTVGACHFRKLGLVYQTHDDLWIKSYYNRRMDVIVFDRSNSTGRLEPLKNKFREIVGKLDQKSLLVLIPKYEEFQINKEYNYSIQIPRLQAQVSMEDANKLGDLIKNKKCPLRIHFLSDFKDQKIFCLPWLEIFLLNIVFYCITPKPNKPKQI